MTAGLGVLTYSAFNLVWPGRAMMTLASLDTPMGGEVAAIIQQHRLDSRLLQ